MIFIQSRCFVLSSGTSIHIYVAIIVFNLWKYKECFETIGNTEHIPCKMHGGISKCNFELLLFFWYRIDREALRWLSGCTVISLSGFLAV